MTKTKKKILWSILASLSFSASLTSGIACATIAKNSQKENTTTISSTPQTMQYQVGFADDGGADNKRYVVWEGDTVSFKYNSRTQHQNNQFNIWNDWFFQQIDNPEVPVPNNKPYQYYENEDQHTSEEIGLKTQIDTIFLTSM